MAYGYYNIPIASCFNCPYMIRGKLDQNIDAIEGTESSVKKVEDTMIPYDDSQYRVLPLLTIPLLFAAAAGPRPIFYNPGPFWPQPFSYYYWYYYR
jgi:hypothetical protein